MSNITTEHIFGHYKIHGQRKIYTNSKSRKATFGGDTATTCWQCNREAGDNGVRGSGSKFLAYIEKLQMSNQPQINYIYIQK